ncbi:hypothetical protein Tco_0334600, partial [Tanacetum coccineum]
FGFRLLHTEQCRDYSSHPSLKKLDTKEPHANVTNNTVASKVFQILNVHENESSSVVDKHEMVDVIAEDTTTGVPTDDQSSQGMGNILTPPGI